ncbi:hypothetical protein YC2023_030851 [Brassica napus]
MTEESPEEDHESPGVAETNLGSPSSKNNNNNNNKEQDRFLPIANVGRIMKKVLPGNGKISKDAKETVQECVSEFISFVTDHQPFPNLPFSPKSLQKQFPQQQHDNTDSIGQWSV